MNKFNIIGIAFWLGSGMLLGFQAISSLMVESRPGQSVSAVSAWENLSLVDMFGEGAFNWITDIPWALAQSGLTYVSTMPTYLFLLCVGLLFIIIGAFLKV